MKGMHERIEELMRVQGIGCNEMDRRLRKSQGYTSRMLAERRDPRVSTIVRISEVLCNGLEFLVLGKR